MQNLLVFFLQMIGFTKFQSSSFPCHKHQEKYSLSSILTLNDPILCIFHLCPLIFSSSIFIFHLLLQWFSYYFSRSFLLFVLVISFLSRHWPIRFKGSALDNQRWSLLWHFWQDWPAIFNTRHPHLADTEIKLRMNEVLEIIHHFSPCSKFISCTSKNMEKKEWG